MLQIGLHRGIFHQQITIKPLKIKLTYKYLFVCYSCLLQYEIILCAVKNDIFIQAIINITPLCHIFLILNISSYYTLMEEQPQWSPFILKPQKINNYTHVIALLKTKQSKYKKYTHGLVNTAFSKVLGVSNEVLDLDSILEGFLHEKIKDRLNDLEAQILSNFNRSLNSKIKTLKVENEQKVYANKIGNIKDVEEFLMEKPTQFTFKDDLLFDLYLFINQKLDPLNFLQNSYLKYIVKFYSQNLQLDFNHELNPESINDDTLKTIVKEFVKLRFNSSEYNIEVYESRYLWAEVFVLYRIGRVDLLIQLISEYEMFFEFMSQKFKTIFTGYLSGKKPNFVLGLKNEDKFKRFLFELADEKAKSDGMVINTVEDYLWLKMVLKKDLKSDVDLFENNKIKFMVALFCKKFNKAIDILLKSDFGVVSKFFLLRELCLEQSCNDEESNDMFNNSNNVPRHTLISRTSKEDSSSTTSLASFIDVSSSINPVFLNFLFNLVSKLSTKEYKVKLIEMLKNHGEYYDIVPEYIIKYEMFDILSRSSSLNPTVEFALDFKVSTRVLHRLKESGDKARIILIEGIIDDIEMIQILKDVVTEAILIDEPINQEIVEKYLKVKISRDTDDLLNLYNFYKFNKSPSLANLKHTVLFDQSVDLRPFKFVIEKIFSKAIDMIKMENDKFMAKHLFKLCGILDLNEECTSKISKDLVLLI